MTIHVKGSNQTVSNSTTMTLITDLSQTLDPKTVYEVEFMIIYSGDANGAGAPEIKYSIEYTGGDFVMGFATVTGTDRPKLSGAFDDANSGTGGGVWARKGYGANTTINPPLTGSTVQSMIGWFKHHGYFMTGDAGGDLNFYFAQQVAVATAGREAMIRADSWSRAVARPGALA